jgi:hypothetical protein
MQCASQADVPEHETRCFMAPAIRAIGGSGAQVWHHANEGSLSIEADVCGAYLDLALTRDGAALADSSQSSVRGADRNDGPHQRPVATASLERHFDAERAVANSPGSARVDAH